MSSVSSLTVGRSRLLEPLGAGRTGIVYRAEDRLLANGLHDSTVRVVERSRSLGGGKLPEGRLP